MESSAQTEKVTTSISEKPKGLKNFASNSYMNSLLQCFYHIKGLRESFLDPSIKIKKYVIHYRKLWKD